MIKKKSSAILTALVVYDKPGMCWYLARRLKEMGFDSIIEAKNGEIGMSRLRFAALKGIDVSLIVSDANLPKVAGVDFIKLVREYPTFKKIPLVILGNFSEFDSSLSRHLEDIICVLNPINADDFKDKVQEALYKANSSA